MRIANAATHEAWPGHCTWHLERACFRSQGVYTNGLNRTTTSVSENRLLFMSKETDRVFKITLRASLICGGTSYNARNALKARQETYW
jgi:hypothetical protein